MNTSWNPLSIALPAFVQRMLNAYLLHPKSSAEWRRRQHRCEPLAFVIGVFAVIYALFGLVPIAILLIVAMFTALWLANRYAEATPHAVLSTLRYADHLDAGDIEVDLALLYEAQGRFLTVGQLAVFDQRISEAWVSREDTAAPDEIAERLAAVSQRIAAAGPLSCNALVSDLLAREQKP